MSSKRETLDLLVVGGGINGAGIARDAAGRGLRVALCEKGDLASATSQSSSKLIHGGLRYLEHLELRLVHGALRERERLLRNAPHLIHPMTFVLPHAPGLRPVWMIRVGLWLYDFLSRGLFGRSRLPRSRRVDLARDPLGAGLRDRSAPGFAYPDCFADDARLVILTARDAADRGAEILTRTACTGAERRDGAWHVILASEGAPPRIARCKTLVNAAGPWVASLLPALGDARTSRQTRLVKGSHVVVPRLHDGRHAFLLQNDDRRVVFVIPFLGSYTLIGTTEVDVTGDPGEATCSAGEIDYLCRAATRFLDADVKPDDVVWTYSGVRPLAGDGSSDSSAVTRDYVFEIDDRDDLPLLSVFGGKLTTYRQLGERAVDRLARWLGAIGPRWTADAALPGGDFEDVGALVDALAREHTFLPRETARGLALRHGTRARTLLGGARSLADLGEDFGAGLYEREVDWLVEHEWARTAEDVLWRRTKAGLGMTDAERARVGAYCGRVAVP